jgi:crossover junction endodeoxyribonuclease RuvC
MRVIAIDPGYDRIGIAIIEKKKNGDEKVLFSECFLTNKKEDVNNRIYSLGLRINELIKKYKPSFLAIESLFFSKNTKTALFVAEARGVIIFNGLKNNLLIYEYTPNQIKIAVTGNGAAHKKDILFMIPKIINIDVKNMIDDELDAIAIGLTFLASWRNY